MDMPLYSRISETFDRTTEWNAGEQEFRLLWAVTIGDLLKTISVALINGSKTSKINAHLGSETSIFVGVKALI